MEDDWSWFVSSFLASQEPVLIVYNGTATIAEEPATLAEGTLQIKGGVYELSRGSTLTTMKVYTDQGGAYA